MKPPSVMLCPEKRLGLLGRLRLVISLGLWAPALALVLLSRLVPAQAQDSRPVDLELALLVDVSASVSDEEYLLQARGLGAAFGSAAVLDAIDSAVHKGIAVTVIQWSDGAHQRVAVDWILVRNKADALWLAAEISTMPRLIHGGHTALGSAVAIAVQELESNGFDGFRRVIDLSGDGRANDGYPLRAAREEALERGITINGLAILNELPLLDDYFRDYLIGGEAAFYMVAQDYSDFAQAMTEKLVREISSVPLSEYKDPGILDRSRNEQKFALQADG